LLVEEEDIGTTLEKSMCCRKTSKATANYDDLSHLKKWEGWMIVLLEVETWKQERRGEDF